MVAWRRGFGVLGLVLLVGVAAPGAGAQDGSGRRVGLYEKVQVEFPAGAWVRPTLWFDAQLVVERVPPTGRSGLRGMVDSLRSPVLVATTGDQGVDRLLFAAPARARFEPARDGRGVVCAASFSGPLELIDDDGGRTTLVARFPQLRRRMGGCAFRTPDPRLWAWFEDPQADRLLVLIEADIEAGRRWLQPGRPADTPDDYRHSYALATVDVDTGLPRPLFAGVWRAGWIRAAHVLWERQSLLLLLPADVTSEASLVLLELGFDGSLRREITFPVLALEQPCQLVVAPDEQRLLVSMSAGREPGRGLRSVLLDGDLQELGPGPANTRSAAWSPDGEQLAFWQDDVLRLWDVDRDVTRQLAAVTRSDSPRYRRWPTIVWDPAGQRLASCVHTHAPKAEHGFIIDVEMSEVWFLPERERVAWWSVQ